MSHSTARGSRVRGATTGPFSHRGRRVEWSRMLSAARSAWVIAGKDLLQRRRDRSAYLLGLVAPLALALVLSLTFGAGTTSTPGVSVGLLDLDGSAIGTGLAATLDELQRDGIVRVRPVQDRASASRALDAGDVSAVLIVPAGATSSLAGGSPVELTVVGNPERPIGTRVAASVAKGFAAEVDAVRLSVATLSSELGRPLAPGEMAEVASLASSSTRPVTIVDDAVATRGFDLTTYYAIGIAVFFLFFTVQFGVLGVLEEREVGTLDRLLAAPIDARAVLAGKLGASFVVGLASMGVLVVATTVLLDATWGAVVPVAVLVVLGVISAIAVSALVATLARNLEQAGGWSTFVAVGLGTLGGSFFPLAFAPPALDALSRITPHRWLLEGLRDASFGAGLLDVLDAVLALLVFITIVGGIAASRVQRLVART